MWHRNLVWKNCCLPVMRELILHADAVKQVRPWTRDLSIQRVRRNCKTAKELGSVLQFVSRVYKHTRFCFERTTRLASGK